MSDAEHHALVAEADKLIAVINDPTATPAAQARAQAQYDALNERARALSTRDPRHITGSRP